jgi:hypothetical protein
LKNLKIMGFFLLVYTFGNTVLADTRYLNYCVTTPTQNDTILIYSDLVTSELKEGNPLPKSLVNNVEILKLNKYLKLPQNSKKLNELSHDEIARQRKMTNFEVFIRKNELNIKKSILENNESTKVYGSDLITVKVEDNLLYSLPYIESFERGQGYGELISDNLIFNGKPVSSVFYYDCGMDSN